MSDSACSMDRWFVTTLNQRSWFECTCTRWNRLTCSVLQCGFWKEMRWKCCGSAWNKQRKAWPRIRYLRRVCVEDSCSECRQFILTEAFGCFNIILVMLLGVAFIWSITELNSRFLSTTPHQWPSSFSPHPSAMLWLWNMLVVVSLQRFRGFQLKIKRVSTRFQP